MHDVDDLLRSADRVDVDDLWPRIDTSTPSRAIPPARRRWLGGVLVSAAAIAAVLWAGFALVRSTDRPAPATSPPSVEITVRNGAVAFHQGGSNQGIEITSLDGTGTKEITHPPAGETDTFPAWSPDGTKIAFLRMNGGARWAMVANADGSQLERLAEGWGGAEPPAWSPDGHLVAFAASHAGQTPIVVADVAAHSFTHFGGCGAGFLSWSPDGDRLACLSHGAVVTVNSDGSDLRTVATEGVNQQLPTWSPTGEWIAYLSRRSGATELYVIHPDGSGQRRLTNLSPAGLGGYSPVWSPDGTRIALEVEQEGGWNIDVVDIDRASVRRLTDAPGDEISPVWSPDGAWVAYAASPLPSSQGDNAGSFVIKAIRADGSDLRSLTDVPGASAGLAWQPRPVQSSPTVLPTPSSPGSTRCAVPSYKVGYLPWSGSGTKVPSPDEMFGPGDAATLYWGKPHSGGTEYVRLTVQSSTLQGSGPGEPVEPLTTQSGPGQLHEGEAPGAAAVYWQVGSDPCGEVVLELVDRDLSRAETRAEIVKVVASIPGPKMVFAHGTDLLVGRWRLYTDSENGHTVMGVLEPGRKTFTVELKPLGGRRFGTRLITGWHGTNLLIQVLDPSTTSARIEMDNGTVVAGHLVELPVELGGPAQVLVAGFVSQVSEEGTKYSPDGVIVAYGANGRELGRRRLSSG